MSTKNTLVKAERVEPHCNLGRLDIPESDSTFFGGATHIEFNDVVYQVARDRLTIHLVDDHLL